ncbi:hypothetical protein BD410DRAFT_739446 [Rickenella mellea]|uniref:Uncharacterized protein n=1 Tax=Rickenella mellea TaxID=50990 RepID=A0A4Y7QL06_9AGAM|nr:hypothetical protein BD410DRAFT_739446 [Rickenella mellea]
MDSKELPPLPDATVREPPEELPARPPTPQRFPKVKLTANLIKINALERLKRVGSKRRDRRPIFPPTSWSNGAASEASEDADVKKAAAIPIPDTPGVDAPLTFLPSSPGVGTDPAAVPIPDTPGPDPPDISGSPPGLYEDRPEPAKLAQRIQALLASLPRISTPTPSTSQPDDTPIPPLTSTLPVETSPSGATRPPKMRPTPVNDTKLYAWLSSATVMNGSVSRGRDSVWHVLETLRVVSPRGLPDCENGGGAVGEDEYIERPSSDVMLYGPLIPDENSHVEIARSEIVSLEEEETVLERIEDATEKVEERLTGKAKIKATEPPPTVQKVVWIPSTTKVSLQTTWWGFRIFLPPPILKILDDKELEAAKRAAMVTAALKWLLGNIPMAVLPPQLRIAVTAAQNLLPILTYIGGFVAWSWTAIKSFDEGFGVILSATWLLPIALIPSTWNPKDFPTPTPPSNPAPAPAPTPPPAATPTPAPAPPAASPPITPSSSQASEPPPPPPKSGLWWKKIAK